MKGAVFLNSHLHKTPFEGSEGRLVPLRWESIWPLARPGRISMLGHIRGGWGAQRCENRGCGDQALTLARPHGPPPAARLRVQDPQTRTMTPGPFSKESWDPMSRKHTHTRTRTGSHARIPWGKTGHKLYSIILAFSKHLLCARSWSYCGEWTQCSQGNGLGIGHHCSGDGHSKRSRPRRGHAAGYMPERGTLC